MDRWRRACARVDIGLGRATVAIVGDSTSAGCGAGTDGGMVDARKNSWPERMAALLPQRLALPAQTESWFGDSNCSSAQAALFEYDPRISMDRGWSSEGAIMTFGGKLLKSAEQGPLSFTPSPPVDRFDVYFAAYPTDGAFNVDVPGSMQVTVQTNQPKSFHRQTVRVRLGVHSLRIAPHGDGPVYIAAMNAMDSTIPAVDICNMGACGATTDFWADSVNPWSPANALTLLAPDLSVIDLGANDFMIHNGASVFTVDEFASRLEAITRVALISGDVVLIGGPVGQQTSGRRAVPPAFVQAQYREAARLIATAHGCLWLDFAERWGSWEAANALGYMHDEVHLTALGYAEKARAVVQLLTTV